MKNLYFWVPSYPDVMIGFFKKLKSFGHNVNIICLQPILDERANIYNNDFENVFNIIYYDPQQNFEVFANEIISTTFNDIHVFCGFLGLTGQALQLYAQSGCKQAIVITEKPSNTPEKFATKFIKFIKKQYTAIVYKKAFFKVKNNISAVFVTGKKGVEQLKSIGIPENILFEFMYSHIEEGNESAYVPCKYPIKFVYIGRFELFNRGMDCIIKAFNNRKGDNWSLDLIGGYGIDAEKIINWAKSQKNVNFLGTWNSDEVIQNMQKYDVCLAPTRMDGWRIQINQAITAGIATITTNEAISDELISFYDTGLVVDAFSPRAFSKAVDYTIEHIDAVNQWKMNTEKAKDNITNDSLANYFCTVLDYTVQKKGEKPLCPWNSRR